LPYAENGSLNSLERNVENREERSLHKPGNGVLNNFECRENRLRDSRLRGRGKVNDHRSTKKKRGAVARRGEALKIDTQTELSPHQPVVNSRKKGGKERISCRGKGKRKTSPHAAVERNRPR